MRLIARFDIKGNQIIKPIRYDGLRPCSMGISAIKNAQDAFYDEIHINNVVASLFGSEPSYDVLKLARSLCQLPIIFSGGLDSTSRVNMAFAQGADRISLGSIVYRCHSVAKEAIATYGSQAIIHTITVARENHNQYKCLHTCAREFSGYYLEEYLISIQHIGFGEIIIVDSQRDGTMSGFDPDLIAFLSNVTTSYEITLSGGFCDRNDIEACKMSGSISAISLSSAFAVSDRQFVPSVGDSERLS